MKATTRFPRAIRQHIQTLVALRSMLQSMRHERKPYITMTPASREDLEAAMEWLLRHLASPHLGHFDGCPKSPPGPPVPLTETEAADVRREVSTAVTALAKALGIYARAARDTSDSAGQHELAEALNAVRCWSMFAPSESFPLLERGGWGVWCAGKDGGHWYDSGMSEMDARRKANRLNCETTYEARPKR